MIAAENLTKSYRTTQGRHVVLDDISFTVARGQKLGVLGRNGAGKSTLIRLISGAEYPTAGRIRRDMSVSWPLAFGGAFHNHLTGFDNLRFICRIYNADYRSALPFIEEFTELGGFLREPVVHYSDGMRARLAFALSLVVEFDCFLIDEVIAVGDSRFHEKCRVELFEKRRDRALIIVSHNPDTIREHCQSAALLKDGKMAHFENLEEAFASYQEAS